MSKEEQIQMFLRQGEILEVEQILNSLVEWNAKLLILARLIKVFRVEVENEVINTVFDFSVELDELSKHFIYTKLLFRRIEFDMPEVLQEELYHYSKKYQVSEYLQVSILLTNVFRRIKVCKRLIELYTKFEGEDSGRVQYFEKTLQYLEENSNE